MRVVKEINTPYNKVTIFNWNGKFLIKFEQGDLEQTYKVDELDLICEDDLDTFTSKDFLKQINENFRKMSDTLNQFHSTL